MKDEIMAAEAPKLEDEFNMEMMVAKCGRVSVNLAPLLMLAGMVTASENNFHAEHILELLVIKDV